MVGKYLLLGAYCILGVGSLTAGRPPEPTQVEQRQVSDESPVVEDDVDSGQGDAAEDDEEGEDAEEEVYA